MNIRTQQSETHIISVFNSSPFRDTIAGFRKSKLEKLVSENSALLKLRLSGILSRTAGIGAQSLPGICRNMVEFGRRKAYTDAIASPPMKAERQKT
ncbi:hypothetical protein [Thermosporothrix hazakensis]|jgi:hypothetical protein|uniref:hypothetical protein n=1 Tax=Thermosporothrix hazakensis TaxID=644383 RepID=UPI001B86FE08|nr:hypothetical protein [Thermosporothrix hazakensis]